MIKKIFRENLPLIIIEILIVAAFVIFYGKFGDPLVDSFREAYIPWQMNEGECLYKDIFCIYPPLAYIINAFLYKIFGTSLITIQIAALLCIMGIFALVYKLSVLHLDKLTTFAICLFTFSALVLSPNVFNGFFPYSYGIIYGLLFTLGSIYCLINKKYPAAYLLYSLAICSKYEFVLLLPVMIFVTGKTDWLKNLIALIIPVVFSAVCLIAAGIDWYSIVNTADILKTMGSSDVISYFYSSAGLIFRKEHFYLYTLNMVKFFIPYSINLHQIIIMWAFPIIVILFGLRYKNLNFGQNLFIISAVLISIKVFFAVALESYGAYFVPFALISLGILLPSKFLKKWFVIALIFWTFVIGYNNVSKLNEKNFKDLYTIADALKQTPTETKVYVYPEGLGINFLSKRKSCNEMYSLLPLYADTFGDKNILTVLKAQKPDYIIINHLDTSETSLFILQVERCIS